MKRIVIFSVLLIASISMTAKGIIDGSLKGESNTEFGTYTITKSDAVTVVNNVAYQTWVLSYSGSNDEFCIFYASRLNGNCSFVVRCDDFEVQYSKNENGFGARYVDSDLRCISKRDVMKKIDKVRLSHQELITSKDKTVEEYLALIACYIPQLLS